MADGSEIDADALRRLEARLDRAAAVAERLLADAVEVAVAGPAAAADEPPPIPPADQTPPIPPADRTPPIPPAGWQRPQRDGASQGGAGSETDLLLAVLAALRHRIPPELEQRLTEAVREVLIAVRALIDWYLERSERRHPEPTPVQDIPIL